MIDSEKYWSLLPRIFLENHGVALTDEQWLNAPWRSTSFSRTLKAYLALPECALDMTFEECDEWCTDYIFSRIYQSPDYINFKPGAEETLRAADGLGLPTCLLSATEQVSLEYTLERLDMKRHFMFWQSTANGLNKHDPEIFRQSARRMGCGAEECLVIEDSLYAMRTARQAGCTVWAIYDDKHVNEVGEIKRVAHRYFEDHFQLTEALRGLADG